MVCGTSICRDDRRRQLTSTLMSSYPAVVITAAVLSTMPLVGVGSSWQGSSSSASVAATSQACVHEGHLLTKKNWYGYLANITVMTTGQLTFEFAYPADKCCQNVLFYTEDQMAVINARMNCWQKEYPLRPEDDQILRLTPRFSWSGCHKTHPNNVATYVCKGGRSFTVDQHRHQYGQNYGHHGQSQHQQWQQGRRGSDAAGHGYGMWGRSQGMAVHGGSRPTTWYIALSNCASLHGLELRYRMEIHGHVGECRTGMPTHFDYYRPDLSPIGPGPSPRPVIAESGEDDRHQPDAAVAAVGSDSETSCVVEGNINTTETWYSIGNASMITSALNDADRDASGFQFEFSFPQSMHLLYMVIYGEAEQARLTEDDSCWHKHSVIPSHRVHDRMLELSPRNHFNGCKLKNTTMYGLSVLCSGRRSFTPGPAGPAAGSERQILVAIDNCRATHLVAVYRVEMYGFACSSAASILPTSSSTLPPIQWSVQTVVTFIVPSVVAIWERPLSCLGSIIAFSSSSTSLRIPHRL